MTMVAMVITMMMVGQEGKIYSYSEQAGSINKDCCNSQSSPGRHSPKQFSAKDSYLFYIFWSISYFLPTVFDRGSLKKHCSLYLSVNQYSFWRLGLNDITPSDDPNAMVVRQNPMQYAKKKSSNWFKKQVNILKWSNWKRVLPFNCLIVVRALIICNQLNRPLVWFNRFNCQSFDSLQSIIPPKVWLFAIEPNGQGSIAITPPRIKSSHILLLAEMVIVMMSNDDDG